MSGMPRFVAPAQFVDADAALARLEAHRGGRVTAGRELWRAVSVELWARTFLD